MTHSVRIGENRAEWMVGKSQGMSSGMCVVYMCAYTYVFAPMGVCDLVQSITVFWDLVCEAMSPTPDSIWKLHFKNRPSTLGSCVYPCPPSEEAQAPLGREEEM